MWSLEVAMKATGVFLLAVMTMLVGFPLVLALIITKRAWKQWTNNMKRTRTDAERTQRDLPSNTVAISREGDSHAFV